MQLVPNTKANLS